ncbi:cytochrome C biogenesis protein CcmH [Janibacter sp. Soil728]|uniref:pyridoxal phosphate-dependent decarboxylase family protein n=1 Tax=Janibacter sp. Soil728 TaxID=1736393 RepID=UPI0006FBA6E4|nr:pyridoxal-dependent decarboxylase [Janibacter sp. Soil728]KRE38905.1 cytochrome C biogenesis protein CcmH [Janibacter sp. Soil728]
MNPHLLTHDTAADYLDGMSRVSRLVARHLDARAPSTGATVADLAPLVEGVDLDRPASDLDAALAEVTDVYLRDAIWFHHPSYVAHLNCPVALPAVLAEAIIAAVNTSVDTWDQSAGGTLVEQRLVRWTAGRIGFDEEAADGVFTSGGTQSNLQGLLLARGEALRASAVRGDSASEVQPRLRVLATEHSHFSVIKSARIMGLHPSAVIPVPTAATGGMALDALRHELEGIRERGEIAMAVVATAGTTDLGVIDPIPAIAGLAAEHGAWVHVDAAYGGGLLLSLRRRHLLDGIERADSVTVDFHKTFFQPVSSSALIVRDAATLTHVTHHADYLNPRTAVTPNQVDKSLQTTRRFDALKLWMTLRVTGADAVGEMFDEVIDRAHQVWEVLVADDRFEVAAEPMLSTVLMRYRPDGVGAQDADSLNPRIRHALLDRGDVMVAGTVIDGRAWLKFTLLNPQTSLEHLRGILETIAATGDQLLAALRDGAGAPPQEPDPMDEVLLLVGAEVAR